VQDYRSIVDELKGPLVPILPAAPITEKLVTPGVSAVAKELLIPHSDTFAHPCHGPRSRAGDCGL